MPEIGPGDPFTISAPVDGNTREVGLNIVGFRNLLEPVQTAGNETVDLVVEDTPLVPGTYGLQFVLNGTDYASYVAKEFSEQYILTTDLGQCVSNIPATVLTIIER